MCNCSTCHRVGWCPTEEAAVYRSKKERQGETHTAEQIKPVVPLRDALHTGLQPGVLYTLTQEASPEEMLGRVVGIALDNFKKGDLAQWDPKSGHLIQVTRQPDQAKYDVGLLLRQMGQQHTYPDPMLVHFMAAQGKEGTGLKELAADYFAESRVSAEALLGCEEDEIEALRVMNMHLQKRVSSMSGQLDGKDQLIQSLKKEKQALVAENRRIAEETIKLQLLVNKRNFGVKEINF